MKRLIAVVTMSACLGAAADNLPHGKPPVLNNGIQLAENGHCREALPLLKRAFAQTMDKDPRRAIGVNLVRCSMDQNQPAQAVATMQTLTRDFPDDPEVLYVAVHIFSDLSIRASQQLMVKAPSSAQVHLLNAEALETQGKWDEAALEYRAAVEKSPNMPGLHFRLGRLLLSRPPTQTTMDDARTEFQAELKLNPENAGAEYVLGEMARRAEQLPDAIGHLTRAVQLDAGFADACTSLGQALLASDRAADAIPPLETAVKLQPENPAAHFHLATAYRRSGRKVDADRESMAHKQTTERVRQLTDSIQTSLK
jgi:predicted Zn-dependent protease